MKIGEPIRAFVVEPLEQPATPVEPEVEDEAVPQPVAVGDTEPEPVPAA